MGYLLNFSKAPSIWLWHGPSHLSLLFHLVKSYFKMSTSVIPISPAQKAWPSALCLSQRQMPRHTLTLSISPVPSTEDGTSSPQHSPHWNHSPHNVSQQRLTGCHTGRSQFVIPCWVLWASTSIQLKSPAPNSVSLNTWTREILSFLWIFIVYNSHFTLYYCLSSCS